MWKVLLHPFVLKEDFKPLDRPAEKQVFRAIEKKLTVDPKSYGKPLRGEFSGLGRLRVGDDRVIYRIVENRVEVLVLKVGIRRDFEVYRELLSRLKEE